MKLIHVLSSIALVPCLISANSGISVAKVTEQVSNPTSLSQTESVIMAGFFDILQDAVQTIESVDGAIDLLDQVIQQDTEPSQENQQVDAQFEQSPVEQSPMQVNTEDLYQRLARRNGEGYEAWYDRINPIIQHVPGADYRAWKATLSSEDREAYDAIVRQRNYEAAEIMNQVTPLILEGVFQDNSRQGQPEYCNDNPEFGSITC